MCRSFPEEPAGPTSRRLLLLHCPHEDLRRHERILQGMERVLLSGKMKPEEMLSFYATKLPAVEINNTFIVCRSASHRPLVVTGARGVSVSSHQGVAENHSHAALEGRRRRNQLPVRCRLVAQAEARRRVLPAAAQFQEGHGATRHVPRCAPKEVPVAFEFRHATWFEDDVRSSPRAQRALCPPMPTRISRFRS